MKKIFLLIALLIASSLPVFTQKQDSSTAPTPTPTPVASQTTEPGETVSATPAPTAAPQPAETIKTDETISFLLAETENARDLISKQETRITDLETENALEKENSASVSKSYDSAKSEIASLKESNAALLRAVAVNEKTISMLSSDNTKQREKAKKAVKDKWKAYSVAAITIALKFLIP